ncbi:Aminopeptidase S [Enhygromyxa salina]|uniref:Aminopeptidase S n=1 Tax=Enhygromyxa salina TaxID=215803 RepID=A0A2S9XV54_9BACT|nr:M28 family peptidase [Enhygromyxa salina]PRP96749.1 Aminopeptidase S [Enhygromyxa salina]
MRRLCLVIATASTVLVASGCKERAKPEPEPEPEAGSGSAPELAEADPRQAEPAPAPECSEAAGAIADEIDAARYEADLRLIAAARPPGSDHWKLVQDHCLAVFEAAGFAATRFEVGDSGVSVVGRKDGARPELPGVVIGAHYDHIEGCAGADDNASGTAAVLELGRVLGAREWDRTLTVACWDEEETRLGGSQAWVDAAVADDREIALYVNFDAVGFANSEPHSQKLPPGAELLFAKQIRMLEAQDFRADFIAILADTSAHDAAAYVLAHAARVELPAALLEIPTGLKNGAALSELRRSDHASFWRHDIPAVFLSDTADFRTDTYHCIGRPDTVETLDLAFATKVVRATTGAVAELL